MFIAGRRTMRWDMVTGHCGCIKANQPPSGLFSHPLGRLQHLPGLSWMWLHAPGVLRPPRPHLSPQWCGLISRHSDGTWYGMKRRCEKSHLLRPNRAIRSCSQRHLHHTILNDTGLMTPQRWALSLPTPFNMVWDSNPVYKRLRFR